uniref:Mitotic checkpoint protein BUB3 n=1 Tax=Kalanchoe fedtschenkoi TaxID=63787 RepID=A0A7N0ZU02_KALFE
MAVSNAGTGIELADPPSDGISNLRFSNHSDNLLVSSWDKTVRLYDASKESSSMEEEDILGKHDAPVRCVEYSYASGQVITGSWGKTLKCWDPRGASGQEHTLVGTYVQPERVYDLRNMAQPEQWRESSLKYQTRCVRCYPNGTGYALSSVEGRVAMEFFETLEAGQSKKYAFKCHRKPVRSASLKKNGVPLILCLFPLQTITDRHY